MIEAVQLDPQRPSYSSIPADRCKIQPLDVETWDAHDAHDELTFLGQGGTTAGGGRP